MGGEGGCGRNHVSKGLESGPSVLPGSKHMLRCSSWRWISVFSDQQSAPCGGYGGKEAIEFTDLEGLASGLSDLPGSKHMSGTVP